jgi:hypothetical protein
VVGGKNEKERGMIGRYEVREKGGKWYVYDTMLKRTISVADSRKDAIDDAKWAISLTRCGMHVVAKFQTA